MCSPSTRSYIDRWRDRASHHRTLARIERAEAACAELRANEEWSGALVDGPRVLGVESLAASGTTLRAQIRTLPARQHEVGRELRRRIKARFEKENLGEPRAQRIEIVGTEGALTAREGSSR